MKKMKPIQSFQSLRSAEGAFDMLHNFKNIKSSDTINALLIKVEGLVVQSNTGQPPKLRGYYSHWERRAFDAI